MRNYLVSNVKIVKAVGETSFVEGIDILLSYHIIAIHLYTEDT
jgi:hypothetical protein